MENLTHTLTGLMLSRAGLHRLSPRASLTLMLAANAPDIDVIANIGGSAASLDWHRGFTHGAPMLPLMALLPVLATGLWRRPVGYSWTKSYLLSAVGLASHLLLDWTNIYGIRLLSPFSQRWFRLDITSVVDIWIWCILLFAVAWPALARLVSSEIGARPQASPGLARFALLLLALYEGGRAALHTRAVATLESRIYSGGPPRQIAALPHYAHPLRWTGLVQLPDRWIKHELNLATEFDPATGAVYYQAQPSPGLEAARREYPFQALTRFSDSLIWQDRQLPGEQAGSEVTATDLRFGAPGTGGFSATATLDSAGRVTQSRFQYRGENTPLRPH